MARYQRFDQRAGRRAVSAPRSEKAETQILMMISSSPKAASRPMPTSRYRIPAVSAVPCLAFLFMVHKYCGRVRLDQRSGHVKILLRSTLRPTGGDFLFPDLARVLDGGRPLPLHRCPGPATAFFIESSSTSPHRFGCVYGFGPFKLVCRIA